ncbi:acetyltransferase [Vibrio cincinnatiensis]|uniref:acetyltransferase n=1 Tax=Vibrio cincinnatiensis TaxID=675 RepID=UPI001EDE997D|nr:acetyltransferase [Vibrio cincinnatiensis]MCG3733742.1 acetyltransferase [Vibrio cincinnatiensis]MCG3740947.1 acetyltransferase [Vibrio cincinnatiensis]
MTKEELSPSCKLVLLSAPKAQGYYPKIGLEAHNSVWILSDSAENLAVQGEDE